MFRLTTGLGQHPSATQVEVPPPHDINYSCAENLWNHYPLPQAPPCLEIASQSRVFLLHPLLLLRSCQTAIRPTPKFTPVVTDACCLITYVTKQTTGDLNATRGNNDVNGPNVVLPHGIFQQYVKLFIQNLAAVTQLDSPW